MSTLQEILNLNIPQDFISDVVISERFKDEIGNLIPFQIKPISFEALNRLKKRATSISKDGSYNLDEGYLNMLCIIESTVNPSFKDAKSIAELSVSTPEQYLNKVLLAGEIDRLIKEILTISGFIHDFEGFVEEIKN